MHKWFRRIWCCLTGGHKYAAMNLESYHLPEEGITCFRNVCVKCGKSYVCPVSDKALYYDVGIDDFEDDDHGK